MTTSVESMPVNLKRVAQQLLSGSLGLATKLGVQALPERTIDCGTVNSNNLGQISELFGTPNVLDCFNSHLLPQVENVVGWTAAVGSIVVNNPVTTRELDSHFPHPSFIAILATVAREFINTVPLLRPTIEFARPIVNYYLATSAGIVAISLAGLHVLSRITGTITQK